MTKEQTYRVSIELEVTATSKDQALLFFVEDIVESYQTSILDAKIECLTD